MPAKTAKLPTAVVAVLPLIIHTLLAALKPLAHYGFALIEPAVQTAIAEARPYFVEATTPEDRAALHRIIDGLFDVPAEPAS